MKFSAYINEGFDYALDDYYVKKLKLIKPLKASDKKLMKKIQIAVMSWLPDEEQNKGIPDFSKNDEAMDDRNIWYELDNGDYEAAYNSAMAWDTEIAKMVKKLKW